MTLIISSGNKLTRLEKSGFADEKELQDYIYRHPESIPIDDIEEGLKLFVLAREFQTEHGPIDALACDNKANVYIIETKLYKNSDKRKVIAQAIDYGAALWAYSTDENSAIKYIEKEYNTQFAENIYNKISAFFEITDEDAQKLLQETTFKMQSGKINFLILMDRLDERLKHLIAYINSNSKFNIYAVEFEAYKFQGDLIIRPKIFGAELNNRKTASNKKIWSEDTALKEFKAKYNKEEFSAFLNLYNFLRDNDFEIHFGTGSSYASINARLKFCNKSVLSVASNGKLWFNFEWIAKCDENLAKNFKAELAKTGIESPGHYSNTRPGVDKEIWTSKVNEIIRIIKELFLKSQV